MLPDRLGRQTSVESAVSVPIQRSSEGDSGGEPERGEDVDEVRK